MSQRKIYLDYLRVLASIAVISIHVSATNWYATDIHGLDWQMFNMYDAVSRWGVPAFVLISGALFLGRKTEISTIYKKYVLRLVTAFVFWGLAYYLFNGDNILDRLSSFFKPGKIYAVTSVITNHYHLWFVPMIAGIYVMIPLFEKIAENEKVMKYYLLVSFIYSFLLPEIITLINDFGGERTKLVSNALYNNISNMNIVMVCGYSSFFVLGYYLSNLEFTKKQRIIIYVLGILGFLFTILANSAISLRCGRAVENYYNTFTVNVWLECVSLFVLFKNIKFKDGKMAKVIAKLSKWSFGAYLVHLMVIENLLPKWGLNTLSMASWISVPVIVLIVFVISYFISAVLNLIPGLKKYIV